MGSLGSGRPRQSPAKAGGVLARTALMWLAAAQRPLTARELWLALKIGEVGPTVLDSEDGDQAVSSLQKLLGDLVTFREDGDTGDHYVYLDGVGSTSRQGHGPRHTRGAHSHSDPTTQAHLTVAKCCMALCASTTSQPARIRADTAASSLVAYAWSHWSTHLRLSEATLSHTDIADHADNMLRRVCVDTLAVLLRLNDVVTGPVTFSAHHGKLRCHLLLSEAQVELGSAVHFLSGLVHQGGGLAMLDTAREMFEALASDGSAVGTSGFGAGRASGGPSNTDGFSYEDLLRRLGPLLGEKERDAIQSYGAVSRELRSISGLFQTEPLCEAFRKENGERPPLDTLATVAGWMEDVARYPFWSVLSSGLARARIALGSSGSSDEMPPPKSSSENPPRAEPARDTALPRPVGISSLRWRVAGLAYGVRDIRSRSHSPSTFTVGYSTSSFSSAVADLLSPIPTIPRTVSPINPFVSDSLHTFYHTHIRPVFAPTGTAFSPSAGFTNQLHPPAKANFIPTTTNPSHPADSSNPGPKQAPDHPPPASHLPTPTAPPTPALTAVPLLLAATLNHTRHTLARRTAQYLWHRHPLNDLRLARSSPDVFVAEALAEYTLRRVLGRYVYRTAVQFAGAWLASAWRSQFAAGFLGAGGMSPCRGTDTGEGTGGNRRVRANREVWARAVQVGYLVWVLAGVEYGFGMGMDAAAWVVATWKLAVVGGEVERRVLGAVLAENWGRTLLAAWVLGDVLVNRLWPLARASVCCARQGWPGLLMAIAGITGVVVVLLKYRSTFFIALEVSGLFVFLGHVLAGLVGMGLEVWADPLGLGRSTEIARASGERARSILAEQRQIEA